MKWKVPRHMASVSLDLRPQPLLRPLSFRVQDSPVRQQHRFVYTSQRLGFAILRGCGPILCAYAHVCVKGLTPGAGWLLKCPGPSV